MVRMERWFEEPGSDPGEFDFPEQRPPEIPDQEVFPLDISVVPIEDVFASMYDTRLSVDQRLAQADALHDAMTDGVITPEEFEVEVSKILPELFGKAA